MLLYTRLAAPKQPKRRSRGGCTFCKEKKKKCDEKRPKCSRCEEQGVECAYEAVKPRQRRRRDSVAPGSPSGLQPMVRRLSQTSHYSHDTDYYAHDHGVLRNLVAYAFDDPVIPSPSDSSFEGYSLSSFTPNELSDCHHEDAPSEDGRATASTAMVPRSKSLYPDLAMIAPCPIGSPLLDFCAPTFSEFSDKQNRRALVDHFCNVLSHLIVFREETGNPFQQLVLPLTRRDSPVTYAIFALACAHLEYRGVENAEKSLYFHNMAIRGVAQLIQHSCKVNRNEILAAIMLLVYYECLVQKGHSNIVAGHLKGALTIMGTEPDPADSTSVFLERAFRFYDVITALSNGTPPLSATPTPGCLQPVPPLGAPSISPLCNVDTLLGMATTLWPIIHRLAGLRALKTELENAGRTNRNPSKTAVLRTEFESTAQAIETALLQWQPQLPPNFTPDPDPDVELMTATTPPTETTTTAPAPAPAAPEVPDPNSLLFPIDPDLITTTATTTTDTDPDPFSDPFAEPLSGTTAPSPPVFLPPSPSPQEWSRLSSIYHNALAYRHAALVYLYRTVLSHARMHAAVQAHARLALAHCVSTVRHRGPMSALLWPLFVSACEAVSPQDRALAERAFVEIDKRQGMRNIDRAWGILGEVWRRGDEEAAAAAAGEEGGNGGVVAGQGNGSLDSEGTVHNELPPGVREDGEELWRRVCREMGVSIVFG